MKKKIVGTGVVIVLAAVCFNGSGCANEVRSAVVAERPSSEKTGEATDKNQGKRSEGSSSGNEKTVLEQVLAPQNYKWDFTQDYQDPAWEGKDSSKMKISISVNAPVEVPDVDGIRIKQVTKVDNEEGKESLLNISRLLGEGKQITYSDTTEPITGKLTDGDIPYNVSIWGCSESNNAVTGPGIHWSIDPGWGTAVEKGGEISSQERGSIDDAEKMADAIVERMSLKDFKISHKEASTSRYTFANGTSGIMDMYNFYFERMVDGVPVNYVREGMYNVLYQADEDMMKMVEGKKVSFWSEEVLQVLITSRILLHVTYENPVKVSDFSDEKLFLVPFEEIRNIFEDTIISKIVGTHSEYVPHTGDFFLYPGSIEGAEVKAAVDRVKLGYMRVRDEDSPAQGTLIPVWDFYGTWNLKVPKENGSYEEVNMDYSNVSLLTIDARDGTIMERDFSPFVVQ